MAYISKEVVVKHIEDIYEEIPLDIGNRQLIEAFKAYIENSPTADVEEVKHGFNTGNANIFECSVCGYGVDDIYEADEKNYPVWEFNFCPHCGAKMDGQKRTETHEKRTRALKNDFKE